jgi:CRP-like cAMP-binding protein
MRIPVVQLGMSSTTPQKIHPNRLIARLPLGIQDAILSKMDLVHLTKQQVIYEQGEPIMHVYFPCSAVISLIMVMEDGAGVEVATIGNEGFLGMPLYFGVESAFARGIVQVPGESRRMRSDVFQREVACNEILGEQLRRYANAQLTQLARTAGCNRLHAAEQRCARWLLTAHDRTDKNEFPLTQEMVAEMLGVTRTSAGLVLQSLEQQGMVRATRGKITILDRDRLLSATCECYRIVKEVVDRSLS